MNKWYVKYDKLIRRYRVVQAGFQVSTHYYRKAAQTEANRLNEIDKIEWTEEAMQDCECHPAWKGEMDESEEIK